MKPKSKFRSFIEIIYLKGSRKKQRKGRARTDLSSLAPRLARFLPATVISTFCRTVPRGTSRIIQQNIASNARGVNVIGLYYTKIAASGSKKKRIAPFGTVFLPTLMEQRNNNGAIATQLVRFDDYFRATNVMARYFSRMIANIVTKKISKSIFKRLIVTFAANNSIDVKIRRLNGDSNVKS